MKTFNLIFILNQTEEQILMCHRQKDPYEGLYNLVGGKVEDGEDLLMSAYREMFEETGIKQEDIELAPFMDFVWHSIDMQMHVYFGILNKEVTLIDEIHPLSWHDLSNDFFDLNKYAGEGNIGHMVQLYRQWKSKGHLS